MDMTMKRIPIKMLGVIFIAMAAFSCTIEEPAAPEEGEQQVAPEGYISFSATIGSGTKTTTAIVDGGSLTTWDAGDEITITVEGDDTPKTYVADQSGATTTFSPKTEADKIPRAEGDVYTLTASYGGEILATQTIGTDGRNDCLKPLAASLDGQECPDGNISLQFNQTAALLDFKFAQESMTLNQLVIKTGGDPGTITVNFTDGLDLSTGTATAQVVISSLAFTAMNGVEIEAHMEGHDTPFRRIILLGKDSQDYKVGKHTRLNMTKFRGAEIKKGADLRELALCINKGWNVNHFLGSDNVIRLANDIDISAFQPWDPIGKNNNKELDANGVQSSYVLKYNFDGQSHTVSGLTINNDVNEGKLRNQYDLFGLFGIVNANISNLNVEGTVAVRSSNQTVNLRAGGIAAVLMPGKTISNCTSSVEVNVQALGRDKIDSSTDKWNATSADCHKWQRVGGIVGECRGNVLDCTNNGVVKNSNGNAQNAYNALTNAHYGGIAGQVCNYGDNNVLISGCRNTANLSWGGKCALAFVSAYSVDASGVADDDMQDQVVQGLSIGGIVGTAGHMVTKDQTSQGGSVTITGCTSTGSVELSNVLGCNAGGIAGRTGCDAGISITDCHIDFSDGKKINVATCSSTKSNYSSTLQGEYVYNGHIYRHYVIMGGIVGAVHCTSGSISSIYAQNGGVRSGANCYAAVGGIIGFISHRSNGVTFNNLENKSTEVYYNSSSAGSNGSHFGGIIGRIARACSTDGTPGSFVTVTNAVNRTYVGDNGKKQNRHSYGGIVGMGDGMYLTDCANYGEVTAKSQTSGSWNGWIGGICGYQRYEDTPSCLENCWSYGKVLYDTDIIYRGLGIGEAEHCRALNCRYCGTIGDVANTANQVTLSSSNWSTYTNDGVHTYASGLPLTPIYASVSDASESTYYGRIGAKASNWQWAYHDSEDKDPFEDPDDPTADPVSSLGGTYATVSAAQHPRLFLNDTDLAALKTRVTTNAASNTQLAAVHNKIIALANGYVNESSPITHTYDASGRRILAQSQKAVKRIFACAYAYRMTGESRYLSKVKQDMTQACSLSDWNATTHMLDAAEMCFAVAVGYDWCYNDLSPELRSAAHTKIKSYALTQTDSGHNYPTMTNNWNQVCYAGMVAGALAIYEKDKSVAAAMVESALANNPRALAACYSNGNYPEGYSYWSYGSDYQALLNLAIKRIFGTCGALETTVDFSKTAKWMLMMDGPVGKTFPYGDCTPTRNMPQYAMWYMAEKCSNTGLLYNEVRKLDNYNDGEMARLLPLVPIAACNMSLPANISGISDTVWPSSTPSSSDVAPVVLVRSGWTGSDDMFLGVKGGKANQAHAHMDAGSFVFDAYGKRWSSDLGSCNYSSVEAEGIALSSYGESSTRWHVFINNRFSHSTLMKQGSSYTDGTGKGNYAANATAPITDVYSSSTEKGAKVDLTDVMYLSSSDFASPEVTRKVVLNPSTGVVTITDHVKNPSSILGGSKRNFWSRILTEASVNKQSSYIELSYAGCAKRYRYAVSSGSATLGTWSATNPGGNQSFDTDLSGDYSIIGCSFSVNAGDNATIVTTLTPFN